MVDGMHDTGERQAELDGVRGLAILMVVVGHGLVPYGFGALAAAGVTLFFALSGYLITGILLRSELNGLGLRRFYARRFTRLAPPLFFMVGLVALFGQTGWLSMVGALTWTENYTQLVLPTWPFGWMWSLGVEEQFYLVWPLLLLAVPRHGLVRTLATLLLVLMLWRVFLTDVGQLRWAYQSLETAGSAIVAGAFVRVAGIRLGRWAAPVALVTILGVSGLAMLAGGVSWMLVPLLVTVPSAVVVAGAAASKRWLSWRPLTFCGVVSYSVYLWHQPLPSRLGIGETPAGVALGCCVGLVAWWLVERPVMRWRAERDRRVSEAASPHGRVGVQMSRLRNETSAA